MKKVISKITLLLLTFMMLIAPFQSYAKVNAEEKGKVVNKQAIELRKNMRRLWIDHVIWSRSFIVSDIGNLEDKGDVLNRLLKNQEDIGNAIKPYYGEEAGKKLTNLLREHIIIAGKIVDAAKVADSANVEKYNKEWYKNADDIVSFLNSLNPALTKENLKELFYTHLKMLTDQVVARVNKDWKKDIEAFDKGEDHIIRIADTLSKGIADQFLRKAK